MFDNVSPATRALEKRRQMYEVQDALEQQQARYAKEEQQFRKQEEQLRARDLQLQHQLIRFNKFLQDNEAKKRRAETRAAEEQAQINHKEAETKELDAMLTSCRHQCKHLEFEVHNNMKYERYLERVVSENDEFSEISDLLVRYDTLDAANRDLLHNQESLHDRNEDVRSLFLAYKKDTANQVLAHNNTIAALQRKLEDIEKERVQLQNEADEVTHLGSQHYLHLGQILMSVENLFSRCVTKRPAIQHTSEIVSWQEEEEGESGDMATRSAHGKSDCLGKSGRQSGGGGDEVSSYSSKAKEANKQLSVVGAYVKDLREIVETLTKDVRQQKGQAPPHISNDRSDDTVEFICGNDLLKGARSPHPDGLSAGASRLTVNHRPIHSRRSQTSETPSAAGSDWSAVTRND